MPISGKPLRPPSAVIAALISALLLTPRLPAQDKDSAKKSPPEKPAAAEVPETRTLADVEKEMKVALAAQNYLQLGRLVEEAAALKDPAAYRAIIHHALRGDDRDLELRAFRALKDIEDPNGLAVLWQEAARNPNYKTRIILLGVAFQRREDPAAFAALAAAVRDPSRPVALTAIRWLRLSKEPARAVPPLIEALALYEKNLRGRAAHDCRNALRELTELNLEMAADWRNYWETRKNAPVKPRPSGLTKVVAQARPFFEIPIESDRILFIIDTSGSMEKKDPPIEEKKKKADPAPDPGRTVVRKDSTVVKKKTKEELDAEREAEREGLPIERQRLYRVKKELMETIDKLPENIQFTVMTFDNGVKFLDEPPRLIPTSAPNKKRAMDWVRNIPAKGETWTDTAFEKAFESLKDVDTIYFLSDGAPYRNGAIPQDQVLDQIKTLNRFVKARIHAIGFRQAGMNLLQFLSQLARDHDGRFVTLK